MKGSVQLGPVQHTFEGEMDKISHKIIPELLSNDPP